MSQHLRYQLWIAAAAGIIFFTYLGAASLWDEDETLYASCAREMLQRGDWVVPMFNGKLFPDKPPLMFWLMMAGFELFGVNEFGARFFSAVLGVGTALLTYHLGRLLFNPSVGLWAGLITASSIIFTVSARAATVDSALVFVTTLAMLCFVLVLRGQRSEVRGQFSDNPFSFSRDPQGSGLQIEEYQLNRDGPLTQDRPGPQFSIFNFQFAICNKSLINYVFFVLLYISLGLAVLAKGPVGFLLPMASLGLFLMIVNHRRRAEQSKIDYSVATWQSKILSLLSFFSASNFLKSLWQLRPVSGAIVVLAVALPWYILVGLRTDGLWLEQFFAKFNLRPFVQPILGHSGPVWYYIPALLIGFFPWSVFLGPAAIDSIWRIRERHPWRDGHVLLACWFGVFFVFWSICSTKLPHYVLPAYPALALLTGSFLETWLTEPARVGPGWMKNAWITTMVVGLCMLIAVAVVARIYLPGEQWIGLVGIIPIVGGYSWLYYAKRQKRELAITIFACTSAVLLTAIFGFAALRVDRHQNAKRLLAEIRSDSSASAPVCAYRFFRQSMVFYAGHPVEYCDTPDELQQFIETAPDAYIITLDKYEEEINHQHPDQFRVLARQQRFLATDNMVVLVR